METISIEWAYIIYSIFHYLSFNDRLIVCVSLETLMHCRCRYIPGTTPSYTEQSMRYLPLSSRLSNLGTAVLLVMIIPSIIWPKMKVVIWCELLCLAMKEAVIPPSQS
jgi:hypothetical protein